MATESYSGRLAFDPDSGFHLAEDGRQVVTPDAGASWLYAEEGDPSHFDRYHERHVIVDGTANAVARHIIAGGTIDEAKELHPHHWDVQPDDDHFGGVRFHPDVDAPTVTSHTDAWPKGETA